MAQQALRVGDIRAGRGHARGRRVPEQVRVNAIGYPGSTSHTPADTLAGQHVWCRPRSLLAAGKQRPYPQCADVQPEQLRQVTPDQHFPVFVALAMEDFGLLK